MYISRYLKNIVEIATITKEDNKRISATYGFWLEFNKSKP